jgi:hypothetical protein
LAKIAIPHINFDYNKYIDEVEVKFEDGEVKNEKIHELSGLQTRLLNQIWSELTTQLTDALEEMKKILSGQAATFADQIEKGFCTELAKLQAQIGEREHYIEEYKKFAEVVKQKKAQIS